VTRNTPGANDGYGVYGWPEFIAFARRLGFMWDLRTIGVVIRIYEGERVVIEHQYAGADVPELILPRTAVVPPAPRPATLRVENDEYEDDDPTG
jgi:hypothetical protein